MKNIITLFVCFMAHLALSAQQPVITIQQRSTASDLVVEGKVIECYDDTYEPRKTGCVRLKVYFGPDSLTVAVLPGLGIE